MVHQTEQAGGELAAPAYPPLAGGYWWLAEKESGHPVMGFAGPGESAPKGVKVRWWCREGAKVWTRAL